MNFDFTRAALKHSSWKLKLRNFLDGKGGLVLAEAVSHKDCELGKWLYAEGLAKYAAMPEMRTLEKEHAMLHQTVKTIVDFRAAGKPKEAEVAFLKIEPISRHIVELLGTLDKNIGD
jgi:methyl-accepting chemotaxis protein